MKQADQIRAFVFERYVLPARNSGHSSVEVRAGDVHNAMGLASSMPSICSALGGDEFLDFADVTLTQRRGPQFGANVYFTFVVSGNAPSEGRQPTERRTTKCAERIIRPNAAFQRFDLRNSLVLLSCVKSKRTSPTEARDIYISQFFTSARSMVEQQRAEWRILSAKHGLLSPHTVIAPYELTLSTMSVAERRAWSEGVLRDLFPLLDTMTRVVFLASAKYREFLLEPLARRGITSDTPMSHLKQGQQLQWLNWQTLNA